MIETSPPSANVAVMIDIHNNDLENRVADILSRMTLAEKIGEMSGKSGIIDLIVMAVRYNLKPFRSGGSRRLGIPPLMFTDGPRGVTAGRSTCFPVAMARGASWDVGLEERIGAAMGIEARARGANFFAGVCVNLVRHPGWGRAQESFGEDGHLLGAMGSASIRGLQRHVMACVKHFACNSIEESRFYVDVHVDERTLREVYLPHFKTCVDAGVASVMSAYNKVNGDYCGHNRHLLRDILKGEWRFAGFVMSDFVFGLYDTLKGVRGGLDSEMPFPRFYGRKLKRLIRNGEVPMGLVDDAVSRILRTKLAFADIGDPAPYAKDRVACGEHASLARESARKSMVLLKNKNSALPLVAGPIRRLAVLGPLADHGNIGDRGSSRVRPPYTVTPLEGIRKMAGDAIEVIHYAGANLLKARRIARDADAVIIVAGLTSREEGEYMPVKHSGGDRDDLSLPAGQARLITAAARDAKRCIVVLEGGSAVTMGGWIDEADAVLMAWYPGMEGGTALAEILFGKVNPSGKLPVTIPRDSRQTVFFNKRIKEIEYGYYHGYRHYDKKGLTPAFHFGFGLSYTEFRYGNLRLDKKAAGADGIITARFDVSNIGAVHGEEIVQLYTGYAGSRFDRALRDLRAFRRVALDPGERKTVALTLAAKDLAVYDPGSGKWVIEGIEYTVHAGSSSAARDLFLFDSFRITAGG